MTHFASMCFTSPLNTQVLFYDDHEIYFYDRALKTLWISYIQYFILKAFKSVNDQSNNNGPNLKLKSLHVSARMNWIRDHVNLKCKSFHMNSVLVETSETFKLSSAKITLEACKKTQLCPLSLEEKGTNNQA